MKAILVIDINDELLEDYENFYVNYDLRATNKEDDFVESIRYVEDCKLKPMPQRKDESRAMYSVSKDYIVGTRIDEGAVGWNACIDEILRGEEK